jgi:hypothetical protein
MGRQQNAETGVIVSASIIKVPALTTAALRPGCDHMQKVAALLSVSVSFG